MTRSAGPSVEGAGGAGEGPGSEIPASAAYRVALPEFEGPLDLLLHLCKTHELDILEIPIAFVTEKYLEYLETMQAMSVEIAAEYLVMAATLAYLKARELVPNPEPLETQAEEGEDGGDPREELIRRLLEYQKYKDAAERLGGRPIEGRTVFGRGSTLEGPGGEAPLAEHSVWKLIESFADILKKAGPKVTHDVVVDRVSISDRINQIVDRLEAGGGSFRFDALVDFDLPEVELRHQLVVTLLAILELAKLRVIRVLKDERSEAFFVAQREGASLEAARLVQATADEEGAAPATEDAEGAAAATTDGEISAAARAGEDGAPAELSVGRGQEAALVEAGGDSLDEAERASEDVDDALAAAESALQPTDVHATSEVAPAAPSPVVAVDGDAAPAASSADTEDPDGRA